MIRHPDDWRDALRDPAIVGELQRDAPDLLTYYRVAELASRLDDPSTHNADACLWEMARWIEQRHAERETASDLANALGAFARVVRTRLDLTTDVALLARQFDFDRNQRHE